MTQKNLHPYYAILAAIAVVALFPAIGSEFGLSLVLSCLMYIALASSWAMFSGATGYISLGSSAFFGLGAYFCVTTVDRLPWPLVIFGAAVLSACFAALAGMLILHLRGTYFSVLTFGMAEFVRHTVAYVEKIWSGTVGRVIGEAPDDRMIFYTMLLLGGGAVALTHFVRTNRFGLALAGIGADEPRAETLGVPTRRMKIVGFALSAAVAGAVGAVMAVRLTYIDPPSVFNPFIGLQTVLIAMIGGAASLVGPVAAAVVFSLLAETLRLQFPYVYMIVLGALLVVAVLFLPGGLAGLWSNLRWQRRRS